MATPNLTTLELSTVSNPIFESTSSPPTVEGDLKIMEELENEDADLVRNEFVKTLICVLLLSVCGTVSEIRRNYDR